MSRWVVRLTAVLEGELHESIRWEARRLADAMRRSRARRRGGTEREEPGR